MRACLRAGGLHHPAFTWAAACLSRVLPSSTFPVCPNTLVTQATPFCASLVPAAAANSTWWGIYSSNPAAPPLTLPDCTFGPLLNWVGSFDPSVRPGTCAALRWMVQQAGANRLLPADLFSAQRARLRLRPA